jgi:uncharacterized protein VirK/YbjX
LKNLAQHLAWFYKNNDLAEHSFWWRARFFLRSILFFKHIEWQTYVRNELYKLNKKIVPILCQQTHRPFYSHQLSATERSDLLIHTHEFLKNKLGKEIYKNLLNSYKFYMGIIKGKEHTLQVSISIDSFYSREGVIALHIEHEYKDIHALVFSVGKTNDSYTCYVGCLQSKLKNENKEILRTIAADLYSAHPRYVLIYILRRFCEKFGIQNIEGVSNRNHIWQSFIYSPRNKVIGSDYNEFWKSIGGSIIKNNNFSIPVCSYFKPIEMYAQKKRNMILKKREILSNFEISFDKKY